MNGQLGVGKKLLGFVDPVFSEVLIQGFSCVFFKKLTEVKFGKIYLLADAVHGQVVLVVLINVFQRHVYNGLLHRG